MRRSGSVESMRDAKRFRNLFESAFQTTRKGRLKEKDGANGAVEAWAAEHGPEGRGE